MALNPRQRRLYVHTLAIWRKTEHTNADGTQTAPTYAKIASGVPCYYKYTLNINDPQEAVGGGKRMTSDTLDEVHLEQLIDLRAGDITQDTTAASARVSPENAGTFHRVEGAPQRIASLRVNALVAQIMELEKPPAGVG